MTKLYGLIGYPLSHSFSKGYFAQKFEQEQIENVRYENFPIEKMEKLPSLFKSQPNLLGLNVTIPYKKAVIPYLDELSDSAAAIGAVNTIKVADGKRFGFNTDEIGFRKSLLELLATYPNEIHELNALVLGTGGAAKAIIYVLDQLNIQYKIVSRSSNKGDLTYEQVKESTLKNHLLIINTTPLGMYPNIDAAPILPYAALSNQHFLYDLVYNPRETLFLKYGRAQEAKVMNGLKMLHLQAEASWKIWNEGV